MRFKVGDKVVIRKPSGKHIYDFPRWVSSMDEFDGEIFEINSVYQGSGFVRYRGWLFNQDWLEALTEDGAEENIHPQDMSLLF